MSFRGKEKLLLVQKKVHDPTSPHMAPNLTAVVQNIAVMAASLFECVRQDGQTVESTVVVDGQCEGYDVGRSPSEVEAYRTEGVAENVPQQSRLLLPFFPFLIP